MGFLIVNTVKEFPRSGVTTGFLLNTSCIRHAKQEYRSDGPIGVIDEEFRILTEAEATEYYYATPVVHVWLKHDLRVFPTVSPGGFVNEDKFPQIPNDRPTEIWVDGTVADFLALIPAEGSSSEQVIDDLTVTVDLDILAPLGATDIWVLPAEFRGKRIRFIRNGIKFNNWLPAIQLIAPDVFMGTDENGSGFEEVLSIENY